MKKVKKFKGFNKHLGYFLKLTTTIFMFVGIAHFCILIKGIPINIGGILFPSIVSYFAIFISVSMIIMAVYYIRTLKSDT